MTIADRDFIRNVQDLKTEIVHVPEWGCDVKLREMTGADRAEYEEAMVAEGEKRDINKIMLVMLALSMVNTDGDRLYKTSPEDLQELSRKSGTALARLFMVASKLNALNPDAVEDLAKNSEPDQSDNSTSG